MELRIPYTRYLVAGVAAIIVTCLPAEGCGLSWAKPGAHFDGVDEQGHVMFVDTLGSLDLGDDLKLPIYAMFKSDWQGSSPYLGQGWMVPLLESRIVQVDDNTFQMWQPDGWYQFMGRDGSTDTILNGQRGWKAVIDGDAITAWASCGWKLTYDKGRLTSITTPQNRTLNLLYESGRVTEVRENNVTVLTVATDLQSGRVTGLTFNDKTVSIEQAEKPVIQQLAGNNVIDRMTQSLSKLTFPDGTSKSYSFKPNDSLEPTLTVDGQRRLTWDPTSALIKTDGEWNYSIKPIEDSSDVALTRTNSQGQSEAYEDNNASGVTIEKNLDGVETKTYRFVNAGILSGKTRKIETGSEGVLKTIYQADYNANGYILREIKDGNIILHDNNGNVTKVIKNGKVDWVATYDTNGLLTSAQFSNN